MAVKLKYNGPEIDRRLDLAGTALQQVPSEYATKDDVTSAIEQAITTALNTEV